MARERVLVWGMSNNRAGTEGVIYNYVKHAPDVPFDFLCYEAPLSYPDLFDVESQNRFFTLPVKIKHPLKYSQDIKIFMREHGHEYAALWFNINDVSNIDPLILAEKFGVPRRITHIHNAGIPSRLITQIFTRLNWHRCLRLTTDRWACGEAAGRFLYGNKEFSVIPNKVDAKACAFSEATRRAIREELGLSDAFVIGTVGRLASQKNQVFLVDLLPGLLRRNPKAHLLFVGDGDLASSLRSRAESLGVADHIGFAGVQEDVGSFLSAMDVFALPSLYEGISLSILEAQYNGLPCVVSEGVSAESIISTSTMQLPLREKEGWTDALLGSTREISPLIPELAARYSMEGIADLADSLFGGFGSERVDVE